MGIRTEPFNFHFDKTGLSAEFMDKLTEYALNEVYRGTSLQDVRDDLDVFAERYCDGEIDEATTLGIPYRGNREKLIRDIIEMDAERGTNTLAIARHAMNGGGLFA
jgi:hypothetical protein